ncbi:unnamed protein product [Cuscuta epithymum]|uniref:Uncharacterized protein n=1 Tax=Cuscuta epithymum TaxID=186058 RepID=A0AAV0C2W0_9ASTE|nr:unnamed protein product [Cuscuta epithymum]
MLMDIIFLNNHLGACMPMFAKVWHEHLY